MELKEEITSGMSALYNIEKKDWYRARTVGPNRIISMLNAITDERKMVGRVLAIYFYNKFVLQHNYIDTRYDMYSLERFLNVWLRGRLSPQAITEIHNLRPADIYPFVQEDETLNRMRALYDNGGSTGGNSHLGFFAESRKLGESLLLSKEELTNKLKELKNEFPDKFKGISDKDLADNFKGISIDYLDGCTDLEFREEGEPEGTIVDITGNSTDVINQPAYKNLMSKVFEEVVDNWLQEHNLTHKDIVWFEYDPDTQQMFVQFDANNINFEDMEGIELITDHTEADEEAEDELEEAFTRDALGKLEKELYDKLKENYVFPEDLFFEDPEETLGIKHLLKLTILIDGDWKHDHLFAEKLVEDFAASKNWKLINVSEESVEDTGRDDYPAYHYFVFLLPEEKLGFFDKPNLMDDAEDINETYSEEELNKLEGKTFNQQKILNIYRRQKYNDSRLFAHTRCVKCGREKRVFLSNLINDPDKYGSCVCSNTNVESRLDNIEDLFDGSKKLSNNTSGYTGVSYVKTYKGEMYDKWRAYIEIDGKRTYLGDFDSKSAAIRARKKAAEKGLKWYKEHKNEFMKNYRKRSKRYRSRDGSKK